MIPALLVFALSFAIGLAVLPGARLLALRLGLVDEPDGRRKLHGAAIPLAGGLGVFAATGAAVTVAACVLPAFADALAAQRSAVLGLALGAVVILAVGLLDDRRGLRGRDKFLGQLLAVGIVISSGVEIRSITLFGATVDLGVFALPLTAFWLLGAVNSLNLIDGMDGLLGSVALIVALALAGMALITGHWVWAAVALALAGSLLAFLCFNLPPASTFLGDSGSMFVGLLVGVLAILSSLKGPATVALAVPVALLTIPIFDSLAAITRRKLTGRGICATDRAHIHHCLQRTGMSPRRILLLLSGFCLLTSLGALVSMALNQDSFAVASSLVLVLIFVAFRLFGHAECVLVQERLKQICVRLGRGTVPEAGHQLTVRLQGSADWEQFWNSLTGVARQLELHSICLDINLPALQEGYHARWDGGQTGDEQLGVWRTELPLMVDDTLAGRLEVTGLWDHQAVSGKVAAIAQLATQMEVLVTQLATRRLPLRVSVPVPVLAEATDLPPATFQPEVAVT